MDYEKLKKEVSITSPIKTRKGFEKIGKNRFAIRSDLIKFLM